MEVKELVNILNSDFYVGVPDSQLQAFGNYLINTFGTDKTHHIIAANEGNCVALAAGYHLATGKIPVVYMQNSGEGNIVNPVVSLLNREVYAIPAIFVIGWRGEPNLPDEPQHCCQGKITLKLLEDMDIAYTVIASETTSTEVRAKMKQFKELLRQGKQVAFVIKKGALTYGTAVEYKNQHLLIREKVLERLVEISKEDIVVSTTGKTSRELFEIRDRNKQSHKYDFLTVGSMGHASSIALGISLHQPGKKVWCVDGDGAMLMHLGAMAVIGACQPANFIHVIINNAAHESVGGMPTVADKIDICQIASGCGYKNAVRADDYESLDKALRLARAKNELCLIEVTCSIGARKDLGRPTISPQENKDNFMKNLRRINS